MKKDPLMSKLQDSRMKTYDEVQGWWLFFIKKPIFNNITAIVLETVNNSKISPESHKMHGTDSILDILMSHNYIRIITE